MKRIITSLLCLLTATVFAQPGDTIKQRIQTQIISPTQPRSVSNVTVGNLMVQTVNLADSLRLAAATSLKGVADTSTVPVAVAGNAYNLKNYTGATVTYSRFSNIPVAQDKAITAIYNGSVWQAYEYPISSALANTNATLGLIAVASANLSDNTAFVARNLLANGTYDPTISPSWLTSARMLIQPGVTYTMSGWKSLSTGSVRYVIRNSSGTVIGSAVMGTGNANPVTFVAPAGAYDLTVTIASGSGEGASPSTSPYTKTFMVNQGGLKAFEKNGIKVNGDRIIPKPMVIYISGDTTIANDTNSGIARTVPVRTWTKAYELVSQAGTIIQVSSDIAPPASMTDWPAGGVIGEQGGRNRWIGGTKITNAVLAPGYSRVYMAPFTGTYNSIYQLWQHDTADRSTLIPPDQRHPYDGGETYWLSSTMSINAPNRDSIEADLDTLKWFIPNPTDGYIYFSKVAGTDLAVNPMMVVDVSSFLTSGIQRRIRLSNIELMYKSINFAGCNVDVDNFTVSYYNLEGGLKYDRTIGVFRNIKTRGGANDGTNAHVTGTPTYKFSRQTDVTFFNLYTLFNKDDGDSHHEYCRAQFYGLYGHHCGSVATPAVGAETTYYNPWTRYSGRGISVQGVAGDGGYNTNVVVWGGISEFNTTNYYSEDSATVFNNCTSRYKITNDFVGPAKRNNFKIIPTPIYNDNAAAISGGILRKEEEYRTPAGMKAIVY